MEEGTKVEELGQPPEWLKAYVIEVLLGGESILPYICDKGEESGREN